MRFELSMHEINMLEIVKVSKTFSQPDGNVKVLDQVNFDLPSAASAALLGESGSGKSTLLHLIAGLDKPDSGDILLDGELVSSFSDSQWNALRRSDLSLIFQQFHLLELVIFHINLKHLHTYHLFDLLNQYCQLFHL